MANPNARTAGENFSPSADHREVSSSTLAVLVPSPVLMLPAPDDRRLVSTIIEQTVVDLAKVAALEHRRHRFLHETRARIHERAHIIDLDPARREILVRRLRERFGAVKCARWGVADRATHELLLKIASPKMIKETKYQHHRKLTEAREAGVAPSEQAYLDWVDAEKERKRKKKTEQQQPAAGNRNASEEDSDQSEESAAETSGVDGKIRFQRLVDELTFTVSMPTENDPVLRIQTLHRERFPDKVGVMIFVEAGDLPPGLTRDVHQLGLLTGYDALADAIQAYLNERKAHVRTLRNMHQRHADSFLRKVREDRARSEGWAEPEPEPPPYTQEEIDGAADEDELGRMLTANAAHRQEQEQLGFETGDEATASENAGDRLAEEPTSPDAAAAPEFAAAGSGEGCRTSSR